MFLVTFWSCNCVSPAEAPLLTAQKASITRLSHKLCILVRQMTHQPQQVVKRWSLNHPKQTSMTSIKVCTHSDRQASDIKFDQGVSLDIYSEPEDDMACKHDLLDIPCIGVQRSALSGVEL